MGDSSDDITFLLLPLFVCVLLLLYRIFWVSSIFAPHRLNAITNHNLTLTLNQTLSLTITLMLTLTLILTVTLHVEAFTRCGAKTEESQAIL